MPLEMRGPGIPQGVTVRPWRSTPTWRRRSSTSRRRARPGHGRALAAPGGQHPGIDRNRELLIEEPTFKAIRTERYMYAEYKTGERELYDLQSDPYELQSLHDDPAYASVKAELASRLHELQDCAGASCRVYQSDPPAP